MSDLKPRVALVMCPPFWIKTAPLGLEYLRNYVKDKAFVDIFDLNILFFRLYDLAPRKWLKLDEDFEKNLFFETGRRFKKQIQDIIKRLSTYDYVGLSLFKRNLSFSLVIARRIQQASKNTRIIFGGPEVRDSKDTLPPDSIIVEGEGEIPLAKIIDHNKNTYFSYQEIDDLDKLKFNDFDAHNLRLYKPILPMLSSRGCVKRCRFCAECTLYKQFRQHCPDYIVDQIEYLTRLSRIRHFSFQDSLLNANALWLEDFCKKIIERRLDIKWEAQIIIRNDMDVHTFSLMKRSGCINLFIGLESGSDKILQRMRKGFTSNEAKDFFIKLQNSSLTFEISLIVGYPTESQQDFKDTLYFLKKNRGLISTVAQVNSFTLYKNSGLSKENDVDFVDTKTVKKRLKKIVEFIEKEKIKHKKAFIDNLSYA